VEIKVLKISGNTIRLGIKAPTDVKILRGELAPFGISETTFEIDTDDPEGFQLVSQAG
jgi:carbon storage regulator CsrA